MEGQGLACRAANSSNHAVGTLCHACIAQTKKLCYTQLHVGSSLNMSVLAPQTGSSGSRSSAGSSKEAILQVTEVLRQMSVVLTRCERLPISPSQELPVQIPEMTSWPLLLAVELNTTTQFKVGGFSPTCLNMTAPLLTTENNKEYLTCNCVPAKDPETQG